MCHWRSWCVLWFLEGYVFHQRSWYLICTFFFLWTYKFQLKLTIISWTHMTHMYSQWNKNIPRKIIDNVPFLSSKFSKYRVTCSKLARELANRTNYSQSSVICPKIYWKECLATTGTTSTRPWHCACLQETTPADLIGKMTWGLSWTP